MKDTLAIFRALRATHWLILCAVAAIGATGTLAIGQRLEDKAIDSWYRQADSDAAVATIAAQNWLAQSETILSGLALGLKKATRLSDQEFQQIVSKAELWNSEFSLDAVAVVKRVLRSERGQIEQVLGRELTDALDERKPVGDSFDHLVVITSSETDGMLRPSVDLLTMAESETVARTAFQVPDKTVMGPAFADGHGGLYTLVGIGLPDDDQNRVLVGRVNLSEMTNTLMSDNVPPGMYLRLSERDSSNTEKTLERPIFGALEPVHDAIYTVTIRVTRGQAQWNYYWDVTPEYNGGAPTANATMVQIGGLIITILVVYSIGVISVQNIIIKRTVEERTQALTREVAERKKAQREQKESEFRLSLHLKHTPLAAIEWDKDFKCIGWNPAAEKIFGFSIEEALGQHPFKFIVEDDLHGQVEGVFQALMEQTGGSHSINENITKDGRKIICEWFNTPLKGDDGVPIGVSSLTRDITEIKTAELKLRQSEQTFHNFYQIIPDVFMITSVDTGYCLDVNEGFTRVTGYSREEVIGKRTIDLGLWERVEDRARLVEGLKKDDIVDQLSANFCRKDGSLWPGIMSARKSMINGNPVVLSATKDVSDIRQSERDAIEANKAKSVFLSSMSHELRTPMNAIMGFAQLLELDSDSSTPLSEQQRTSVSNILKGSYHLMELIDQILDLAKIETGKLVFSVEEVFICDIAEECLSLVHNQALARDLEIENKLVEGHSVRADYTRFKQVLLNLLSNAIKYNQKGGNITLSSAAANNDMIRVTVSDTGSGIASDKQSQLFEPFDRLGKEFGDIQGTGIGLTITLQLVEAMGGRVGYESDPGIGSRFWVELPTYDGIAKKINLPSDPQQDEGLKEQPAFGTVLYIEDNPANLQLMEAIIDSMSGVTLISAHNAELGLVMAEEKQPDLILMDINLPGIDGLTTRKILLNKDKTKHIPVIAVTAAITKDEIERGLQAGFEVYLTKPFSVKEVIKVVGDHLTNLAKK